MLDEGFEGIAKPYLHVPQGAGTHGSSPDAAWSARRFAAQGVLSTVLETTLRLLHYPPQQGNIIKSPMVGTFYSAPSPDADPFLSVGSKVAVGQVVCIVEAMKLMNEIKSEIKGTVTEIHAKNGEPVEFGQPLFSVKP